MSIDIDIDIDIDVDVGVDLAKDFDKSDILTTITCFILGFDNNTSIVLKVFDESLAEDLNEVVINFNKR